MLIPPKPGNFLRIPKLLRVEVIVAWNIPFIWFELKGTLEVVLLYCSAFAAFITKASAIPIESLFPPIKLSTNNFPTFK